MTSLVVYFAAFKNRPLSPPCFVLPAQGKSLIQDVKGRRSQYFTFKSLEAISTSFHNWGAMKNLSSEKMYVLSYILVGVVVGVDVMT